MSPCWESFLSAQVCRCSRSAPAACWIPCRLADVPRSLLGFCSTGLHAGDRDALPSTSQDARLTLRHRLLLAAHFHTDIKPFFLALRRFSADTFAATGVTFSPQWTCTTSFLGWGRQSTAVPTSKSVISTLTVKNMQLANCQREYPLASLISSTYIQGRSTFVGHFTNTS